MITCKEDLIGCYVDGSCHELARAFQERLFSFGIHWLHFDDQKVRIPSGECRYICFNGDVVSWNPKAYTIEHYNTQLTLSDLKPRTKVEYEKVTESIFDLKDEFESLNLYDSDRSVISDVDYLAELFAEGEIYRKVERPVEWWEDALEYVVSLSDDDIMNEYDHLSESISIKVSMNRKQAQDFARIILEQEGE